MNISEAFNAQRRKSLELRSEKINERVKRLRAIKKWILTNRVKIQNAVRSDLNKPIEETDLTEIYIALADVKSAIRNLLHWSLPDQEGTSIPYLETKAEVFYEPKGVVLIISPWNYPFNLSVGSIISTLAAGNTIFLKPSELSSHTSSLLQEMANELFEEDILKVVQGGVDISTELLALPFNHIFFTGSPRVGKVVMEAASKHLASVTLELGGKSPCVVDESANIKDSAEKIAWGKWLNAGQTCLAPDYLLVHEKISERFIQMLKEQAIKQYGGEDYSSIISEGHYVRLTNCKKEAIKNGADVFYEAI